MGEGSERVGEGSEGVREGSEGVREVGSMEVGEVVRQGL